MAFTLQIKKRLFGKNIEINEFLKNTGMRFGSYDDQEMLRIGESVDHSMVLYNPRRLGRGIFFDYKNRKKGSYEVSMQIPTTPAEIRDFINIVKELEREIGRIDIKRTENGKKYTVSELETMVYEFDIYNLKRLHEFIEDNEKNGVPQIMTLAFFPYKFKNDQILYWKTCDEMRDFEDAIDEVQQPYNFYEGTEGRGHNDSI
ncbi:hypothetical protein [Butyrivibrio sp. NC3005]|uniref:hypothetical protein n=1 Tax=Butyrivibrio sp. NC3005 TaxID=1280685 RepID=UPI00040D5AC4|nr:hypothetical protein [Butyrivibrio sp. NC3005]